MYYSTIATSFITYHHICKMVLVLVNGHHLICSYCCFHSLCHQPFVKSFFWFLSKQYLQPLSADQAYDLTKFAKVHPGGAKLITDAAGMDATVIFDPIHPKALLGGEELEGLMGMRMNVAICTAGLCWNLRKKNRIWENWWDSGSAESGDLFDDVYIELEVDDVFCHISHDVYNTIQYVFLFSPDDYSDDHPRCSFCDWLLAVVGWLYLSCFAGSQCPFSTDRTSWTSFWSLLWPWVWTP